MDGKIINEYYSEIKAKKYKLAVKTIEKSWQGHDSGKMEDRPGRFLEASVSLANIGDKYLSLVERLAIQKKVVLHEENKEISDEPPKGYAKLFHKNLVEKVRKSPDYYLEKLQDWKDAREGII